MKLITRYEDRFKDFLEIEQNWADIFYWIKR